MSSRRAVHEMLVTHLADALLAWYVDVYTHSRALSQKRGDTSDTGALEYFISDLGVLYAMDAETEQRRLETNISVYYAKYVPFVCGYKALANGMLEHSVQQYFALTCRSIHGDSEYDTPSLDSVLFSLLRRSARCVYGMPELVALHHMSGRRDSGRSKRTLLKALEGVISRTLRKRTPTTSQPRAVQPELPAEAQIQEPHQEPQEPQEPEEPEEPQDEPQEEEQPEQSDPETVEEEPSDPLPPTPPPMQVERRRYRRSALPDQSTEPQCTLPSEQES